MPTGIRQMLTLKLNAAISLVREHLHSLSNRSTIGENDMSFAKSEWALALIAELGHVEGATRLHKYAFLAAKRVKGLTDFGFYNDWEPSNYGPFSKGLAGDVESLLQEGLIKQSIASNKYGYKIVTFQPTDAGLRRVNDKKRFYSKQLEEIRKMLEPYQKKRLIELLSNVYYLYPSYATKSKIRAEVGRHTYESDSYLNPEYD